MQCGVRVLFLFIVFCLACEVGEAFVESLSVNEQKSGNVTRQETGIYSLTVNVTDGKQPVLKLMVASSNASPLQPLLVSVQQENVVTVLRVPYTESNMQYQYISRTLCPFYNRRLPTGSNSSAAGTEVIQLTLSTSSDQPLLFTVSTVVVEEFYLQLNSRVQLSVNPARPALHLFSFPASLAVEQVRVLLEAAPGQDSCSIIHVQDLAAQSPACPSEVSTGTLNFQGDYQTMLSKGVVLRPRQGSGSFFISVLVTVSDLCSQQSSDLLAAFSRSIDVGSAQLNRTSDLMANASSIMLSVLPGLTELDYAAPAAGMTAVFLVFYVLALVVIVGGSPQALARAIYSGKLCVCSLQHVAAGDDDDDEEAADQGLKMADTVEEVDGWFEKKPPRLPPEEQFEMQEMPHRMSMSLEAVEASLDESTVSGATESPHQRNRSFSFLPHSFQESKERARSLGRRHNAASEAATPTSVATPSLAEILSGRYNEVKKRSNSISRRDTPTGSAPSRPEVRTAQEQRAQMGRARSRTMDGGAGPWRHAPSDLRPALSLAPADRTRPVQLQRRHNASSEGGGVYSPQSSVTQSVGMVGSGGRGGSSEPELVAIVSPLSSNSNHSSTQQQQQQEPWRPSSPVAMAEAPPSPQRASSPVGVAERPCSPPRFTSLPLQPIIEVNTLPRPLKDKTRDGQGTQPVAGGTPSEDKQAESQPKQVVPVRDFSPQSGADVQKELLQQSTSPGQPLLSPPKPHPLATTSRQHSTSECPPQEQGGSPLMGRRRTNSLTQDVEAPVAFKRLNSKDDRSSGRLDRSSGRLDDEAETPLLRGDPWTGGSEELASSSEVEEPPAVVPSYSEVIGNGNAEQVPGPHSPSLSPVSGGEGEGAGEGRTGSAQPMVVGMVGMVEEAVELYAVPKTLGDLEFPEGKLAQRQSNRFLWQLVGLSLFYMLPAYQLVIAYLKFLEITGNRDLCYFNDRCSWPVGIIRSFNSVWSNIGYVILGFLLLLVVVRAKYNYRAHEREVNEREVNETGPLPRGRREGVPQYFGIYFALAFVLIAQGFLSAAYHICPNQATFQFDTTFMYIMAGLTILRVFQSRHPDSVPSASFFFIAMSFLVIVAVVGTLHANLAFYIVWLCFYLMAVAVLALLFYFKGRVVSWETGRHTLTHPSTPGNTPKIVFVALFVVVNIGIGVAGVVYRGDFGSHLLVVFISNFALYMLYHIIASWAIICWKRGRRGLRRGSPAFLMVLYFVVAFLFWLPAIYFFIFASSDWTLPPSESRNLNRDCTFWGFYDYHDLWHFLSAFALFFSMLAIMNLDKKQRHNPREEIYLF